MSWSNPIRIASGQIGNTHASGGRSVLQRRTAAEAMFGRLVAGRLPRLQLPSEEVPVVADALKRPNEAFQVQLTYGEVGG